MIKSGGVFLGIILSITAAFAQDKTTTLLNPNNPNLINLNESTTYHGQPLVYIQGFKAPEKAKNDLEELQIKLFGTKNVRSVTKNTLTFDTTPQQAPVLQDDNFSFQTPFHQSVQAGFIRHIPDFIIMIQLLNAEQITVTEQQIIMNTENNTYWNRHIPLPPHAVAQMTTLTQNNVDQSISDQDQKRALTFQSNTPLTTGLNYITAQYNIQLPSHTSTIDLDLTGQQMNWPVERMKVLLLVPTKMQFTTNQLTFGTNQLPLPDIYTQSVDEQGNTAYLFNQILPPNASIQLHLAFDPKSLKKLQPDDDTLRIILIVTILLLLLYWIANYWWENHRGKNARLSHLKFIKNPNVIAKQIGTNMTQEKWEHLLSFQNDNGLNTHWEHKQDQSPLKIKLINFLHVVGEIIFGTLLILIGSLLTTMLLNMHLNITLILILSTFSACGIILLYHFLCKNILQCKWQHLLDLAKTQNAMLGLTTKQALQIYPLMVIAGDHNSWVEHLRTLNPVVAQNVHLNKGA